MRHLLGIGCQRLAFNRLGIEVEMVGISEIDKYALQSYMAIHGDTKNFGSICDIQSLPEVDVFTWSFPCTDLSKAGKQKGLTNTRSGLVYEVLRILHNTEHKPKVLIMENVVDLVQTKFIREFQSIQHELELMGYTNYAETMNAKDYGVVQNRDRVFMVSILGEYYYEFPKPFPLEKRLKDYLEESVDEKYYLSFEQIQIMENTIFESMGIDRVNVADGVCNTIMTMGGGNREPKVMEYIAYTSTIITGNKIDDNLVWKEPVSFEQRTDEGMRFFVDNIMGAMRTTESCGDKRVIESNQKIRKLTPLECWRLMGIDDKDFRAAEKVCSNSQLYKQAGNGIVVDVFARIIEQMKGKI